MTSNLPSLLFFVPFLAALVCAITCWTSMRWTRVVAIVALAGECVLAAVALERVLAGALLRGALGGWRPPLGIELRVDLFSALMVAVVSVVALLVIAGAMPTIRRDLDGRDAFFYPCVLLLIGGLVGMSVTHDLFNLFVHLEVASLSAYCLVAAGKRRAPRAAMQYLILGSLAASVYLLGVGFLYAATGTLNMTDMAVRLVQAEPQLVVTGTAFIVGGLAVKMGLFPVHGWMPAAYSRSPAVSAALMAPLVTKVAAYALFRILFWVLAPAGLTPGLLLELLCWAGAVAMIAGAIAAMLQDDLRRLLAYSSVSQMGLIALGIGLASPQALTGAMLHIVNDAFMKGALFLAAGAVLFRFDAWTVNHLSRLRGRAPWTSAAFAVAGFSLIGLPPFCGFFGKWYVLLATLEAGRWLFAAALVVGSLATAGYVFRLLEQLYFKPAGSTESGEREGPLLTVLAVAAFTAAIVLIGVFNERIVTLLVQPGLPGVGG